MDNEQSRKRDETLRDLPSVDRVLRRLQHLKFPVELLTAEVRLALEERRAAILNAQNGISASVEELVERKLARLSRPSLRRVINATGVVLHTNLGRAPLGFLQSIAGYSNLEYDLDSGKRGKRDQHTSELLHALLGCSAIVVNNNAAAVYLVLNEMAAGREVIVSRGELIEIGDGFRIPEIMLRSGAVLLEVGTTNRTHITDYSSAVGERTALIMRVHPSNFQIRGFTAAPELGALTELGRQHGLPVYEDLGSGCLVDLKSFGVNEPLVSESIAAGVDLVSFSGDKLLGGPQCGIIAGRDELVARIRRNPMYRALRVDKLIIEALETTLRHVLLRQWEELPALKMIMTPVSALKARAETVLREITAVAASIRAAESPIGGGSTPDQLLPTWLVELAVNDAARFARKLRHAAIPIIGRIEKDRVVLDMRTVSDDEIAELLRGLNEAAN